MKENPEFIGRSYEKEERARLKFVLGKWAEEGEKPMEGEQEKTEEEIRMIESANEMMAEELHSIGIEDYKPLPPQKVHFFSAETFRKKFPDFEGSAFFLATSDNICVDRSATDSQARVFSTLLHEFIHRASSFHKFYADRHKGVYDARSGYRIRSPWKGPERERRLLGFNEIMNDYTVFKIMAKNQEKLKDFGITPEDVRGPLYTWMRYTAILELVVKKIASRKNISNLQVFTDLERGQFQKNILVLKEVERAFGREALRILSLLGTLGEESRDAELESLIKRFFSEEDKTKRAEIQKEINAYVDSSIEENN